jgi:hypothetical protein
VVEEQGSLVDRLGVTPDSVVSVPGMSFGDDTEFQRQVRERAAKVYDGTIDPDVDIIFMKVGSALELSSLKRLQRSMKSSAAIWVVWPKGKPTLQEDDVRAAAQDAGLVDTNVVSFSDSHAAMKLINPATGGEPR